MTKIYNLYFGEGKDQLTYYKPSTPEKELQDLIDDPDAWKKYLKDQKDTLELVENERDALENERDNLETERDQLKQEKANFEKFLKDKLGYNDVAEAVNALAGKKLSVILTNAEATIKTLKASEDKLKKDIGVLNTQIANMVDKDELVKAVNEKNNAITQLGNLGTQYGKLETAYNNLKNPYDALNTKWQTTDFNNIDWLITRYRGERNAERKKISDSKKAFEDIVKAVNKKSTAIFGDITKKNIRKNMGIVKNALGFADIDPISEQEDS